MEYISLNNWSINGNKAAVSLLHLHAKFQVLKNDESVYFQLVVTDSNMEAVEFNFYTLEDVIFFTQNVVSKCWTKDEALSMYQKMYDNGEFRLPGGMKPPKNNKISLIPDEVDQILVEYFSGERNHQISVDEELFIDYYRNPQITFFLTEHLICDGVKKNIKCRLTDGDIKKALANYVDFYGYELEDFKYIGGVHKVGMFVDEDTPYYEGVELTVKEREKSDQTQIVKKRKKTK